MTRRAGRKMGRSAFAPALVVALALGLSAFSTRAQAQEPPELPPPPPPKSAPQYTPPPTPVEQPTTTPPPSRREPPSRRDREREREQRERERERAAAAARQAPPPPPPPVEREREPAHTPIPFQAAVRLGVSFPGGSLEGADGYPMSRYFDYQVPVLIEAGFKIHPMILLGGYGSFALGAVSQNARSLYCDGRSCVATSFRVGAQIQAQFRPGERLNPWASYGLGFESSTASASDNPNSPGSSATYSGFEFARLALGLDFRVSHLFGLGPFVEVAFGSYGHAHTTGALFAASVSSDRGITDTALHDWVTFGVRGVLFP